MKAKDYNTIKSKNPFKSVEEEQIEDVQKIKSKYEALNNLKKSQSLQKQEEIGNKMENALSKVLRGNLKNKINESQPVNSK